MYTKITFVKSFIASINTHEKSAASLAQATIITGSNTNQNQLLLLPFPQRQRHIQILQQVRFTKYLILNLFSVLQ